MLHGKRVLITRTRQQASELACALEALGATPILIPTIEIVPPASEEAFQSVLANLSAFDWLLFTSANAVDAFSARLHAVESHLEKGQNPRIAAIGPATARALQAAGLTVDLIPPHAVAESLADALLPHAPGSRMALIRAEQARDHLPDTLRAAGATVTIAEAYRTVIPESSIKCLQALFASNPPDAIIFTSSSTATNLFALLRKANLTLPPSTVLASIGPITSQTLRDLGHPPHVESPQATTQALAEALAEALARHFGQ